MPNPGSWTRRRFVGTVGATCGAAALGRVAPALAAPARAPNIILILADDLGYGDLSCFGSQTIHTPHVDRLAEEGARFTDLYACAAVCTPSRAGLLTGRYQLRVGLPRVLHPKADTGISHWEVTLAEGLRRAGYATCCIGKWHLGDRPRYRPLRHGFDRYYGLLYSNDMNPLPLYRGDEVIEEPAEQSTLTERYTQEAVQFIRDSRDRPFFLYVPHTMPHVPLHVSPEFAGRSQGGLYGDVVECVDWSVGEIARTVDGLGLRDNTLLLFTSDNGPWLQQKEHGGSAGPLRAGKGTAYEGGVRVPFVARWPGRIPAGHLCAAPVISLDLYTTALLLAGVTPPRDRVVDGRDMLPVLTGRARSPHDMLCFCVGDELRAVRGDNWKLHLRGQREGQVVTLDPPELYDLAANLGETTNVAEQHPEVVAGLRERIATWEAELARERRERGL